MGGQDTDKAPSCAPGAEMPGLLSLVSAAWQVDGPRAPVTQTWGPSSLHSALLMADAQKYGLLNSPGLENSHQSCRGYFRRSERKDTKCLDRNNN